MKYLIKTAGLIACLIIISACEFGKAPDMSKYEGDEEQITSLSFDGCNDDCLEQFQNLLIQKYGENWDTTCDEKCLSDEYTSFFKTFKTSETIQSDDTAKKAFQFPQACDDDCQSEFMTRIVFYYGDSCDDACKKAEFEAWYADFTPPTEAEEIEIVEPEAQQLPAPPEGEGEKNEPANPPAPPTPPSAPAQPVVGINTDEINKYMGKLGFGPDTVVILTPKFALSSLDFLKGDIKFTTEQGMLIDMLPTVMTKAKYLILVYQRNTSSFVVVSPDAVANRDIETVILKSRLFKVVASDKNILKLGSNIGFAKLSDAILAGTPYSLVDSILKGTAPGIKTEGQSHAKCISILKDKTFTGFMSRVPKTGETHPQPNFLQQLFNLPGTEQKGPNNAACWYKVRY